MKMRQLVIDRILELEQDGMDLSDLEFFRSVTTAEVPQLTDAELLELLQAMVCFQG
jgi:uncharacterized protein Smg (DUF494 family)